jgi:hypothetical protein
VPEPGEAITARSARALTRCGAIAIGLSSVEKPCLCDAEETRPEGGRSAVRGGPAIQPVQSIFTSERFFMK